MMNWLRFSTMFFTAACCSAFLLLANHLFADEPKSPLTPEQALQTFQLDPSLRIEVAASEPVVQDPVAICWDAQGAMYVAEMGDYPALPMGGRIKRLVDADSDGRYESATTFSSEIAYPTGVLPHRDGILVTAAPDILFLKDTDGDGIADVKQRLLTGFGEGNQQLRVNSLVRGLDGWIYGANGRSDGEIGFVGEDGKIAGTPVSIRGTDFRFDPERKLVETAGGFTQFGQAFDDYGNRFISWNTVHIRHVVMEPRYLIRNPKAAITSTTQEISDAGSTPRLFPISVTTKRFNAETPGFFNASCGLTIFRGQALGNDYKGNAFCCEPLSNVVHRDVLTPSEATFIASRAANEQDREFLASTDSWFRPVNLATGPDGALYVVDFYRKWVEHPQWVANEEARKNTDWDAGKEFGRIYRVRANDDAAAKPVVNLAGLSNEELVPLLGHPNAWQRETAQRLLLERNAVELAVALREMSHEVNEEGRVHALSTLAGLKAMEPRTLMVSLSDDSPKVQRVAIGLAEQHFVQHKDLVTRIEKLAESGDSQLRYQVACSLSYAETSPDVLSALASLFVRDGHNPWMRQAVFAACGGRVREFFVALISMRIKPEDLTEEQVRWLIAVVRSEAKGDQSDWFPSHRPEGLSNRTGQFWAAIRSLGFDASEDICLYGGGTYATSDQVPENLRLVGIGMLRYATIHDPFPILRTLLASDQPLNVQQWAAETAFAINKPESVELLVTAYRSMTPSVQQMVLDHLVSRKELAVHLAEAIESQAIPAADLAGTQRDLLASSLEEPVKTRITALWAPASNEPKDDLIRRYSESLSTTHDVAAGKLLFQQHCRTCHQRQGDGNRVGPDLTGVAGRSPNDILADVLDPNRSVSVDGRSYALITKDGVVFTGVLAGETGTSVSIKKPGGAIESILRTDIEQLQFTGKSLMPDGFDRLMSPTELANLIAFLKDANIQ